MQERAAERLETMLYCRTNIDCRWNTLTATAPSAYLATGPPQEGMCDEHFPLGKFPAQCDKVTHIVASNSAAAIRNVNNFG